MAGTLVEAPSQESGRPWPCVAPGALVIGGDYRGLGIVRSLGRQGIPVWVLQDEHAVATFSRYARRSLPWPDGDETRQCGYLLDLCRRFDLDGWALYPTGDATSALVARYHAQLSERFRLTTPPWEVLRFAHDKRLTYRLAAELDLDHPWTRYPETSEELAALDCTFPVILKPAWKENLNAFTRAKAWKIDDREALLAWHREACTMVAPETIMVQELIPGGGEQQFSYAALCARGKPLVEVVARRTRQYPIEFGMFSTYVESVDRPDVEAPSRRFLAALEYTGLIELEYKHDPRNGRYKLLDINPRVWGWHTLGQRAGADFPYLLWQQIHGRPVPQLKVPPGVRWTYMSSDLLAVVGEIRRGRLSLLSYLRSLRNPLAFAIFAPDDPLPAAFDAPLTVRRQWQRRRK